MFSTNSSSERPLYVQMLEQLTVAQLKELIETIGMTCRGADYGSDGNTVLGAAMLRAAVNMFEGHRCKVELTIDSAFWDSPAYYKTGHGACLGDLDVLNLNPADLAKLDADADPDNC